MKFITKRNMKINNLVEIAIKNKLYENDRWMMLRAYNNVLNYPQMHKSTEVVLLVDNDKDSDKFVGAVYFNDKFSNIFYDVNIMMYIHPDYRKKGYATELYKKLNKVLNSRKFKGDIRNAQGIPGSDYFWSKMDSLRKEDSTFRKVITLW